MNEIEVLKNRMDAIAGAQQALTVALSLAIQPYKGNSLIANSLESAFEQSRSSLLASLSSDYMIRAFDEIAETLVEEVRGRP